MVLTHISDALNISRITNFHYAPYFQNMSSAQQRATTKKNRDFPQNFRIRYVDRVYVCGCIKNTYNVQNTGTVASPTRRFLAILPVEMAVLWYLQLCFAEQFSRKNFFMSKISVLIESLYFQQVIEHVWSTATGTQTNLRCVFHDTHEISALNWSVFRRNILLWAPIFFWMTKYFQKELECAYGS